MKLVRRTPILATARPDFPLESVDSRFRITRLFPSYRNHFSRGRSMTHFHLASIEVDEVIDADQADRHVSATHGAMLPARRVVATQEHLRGPAAARLAWRRCR